MIAKDLVDKIIEALKEELEYMDYHYGDNQWIMAVGIKKVSKDKYLARTVSKTNQSPYVDGLDITVNIVDGEAEVDLTYIGAVPIFHSGEIEDSMKWIEKEFLIYYLQLENPFK